MSVNQRYAPTKKYTTVLLALCCAGAFALLTGCKKHKEVMPEAWNSAADGKVYLSFDVANMGFGRESRLGLRYSGPFGKDETFVQNADPIKFPYKGKYAPGANGEEKIRCLEVFLFSKGSGNSTQEQDRTSVCKYHFSFALPEEGGVEQEPHNAKGVLVPIDPNGAKTSVKLVEPGRYRAVVMANTKLWVDEKFSDHYEDNYAYDPKYSQIERHFVDLVNTLYAKEEGFGVGMSYERFKSITDKFFLSVRGSLNFHSWTYANSADTPDFYMDFWREHAATGSIPVYVNDEFVIPRRNNTPQTPIVRSVDLLRHCAYLEVRYTNQDENGNVYPETENINHQMWSLWNYDIQSYPFDWGTSPNTYLYDPYYVKELLPMGIPGNTKLDTFKKGGRTFTSIIQMRIPAYRSTSEFHKRDYIPHPDPVEDEGGDTRLYLLLECYPKGYNILAFPPYRYRIPVLNPPGTPRPSYVLPEDFNQATILRNTYYRIDVIFKGPKKIAVQYSINDWTVKERELKAAE